MKLFVGLGNPGMQHIHTRHNIGQDFLFHFIEDRGLKLESNPKFNAKIATFNVKDDKVLLSIDDDYMNNSGISVRKISDYFKIDCSDIFIIHDDLDLPVGEYRVQFDRGPAGHNGVRSIIDHLKTKSFYRIRIGISKPENKDIIPVEDYVLMPFKKNERDIIISKVFPKIEKEIENILGL